MRIAIAVWESRISPVFDAAEHLLILDVENGREVNRIEKSILGLSTQKRVDRLVELDVDMLLCGAISRQLADMVAASGIRVIPWVTGEVGKVRDWYLTGKPIDTRFLMPGCDRHQRHLRGARRNRPARYGTNNSENIR